MERFAVLTAIGEDRPGLVDALSEFVFARGANIAKSHMANLHGQFAVIMLVSGSIDAIRLNQEDADALLSRIGVDARFTPGVREAAHSQDHPRYMFHGEALDKPGLVFEIAHAFYELSANIQTLETMVVAAPFTGSPIFTMRLVITVPKAISQATLNAQLELVCEPLGIDWTLEDIPAEYGLSNTRRQPLLCVHDFPDHGWGPS